MPVATVVPSAWAGVCMTYIWRCRFWSCSILSVKSPATETFAKDPKIVILCAQASQTLVAFSDYLSLILMSITLGNSFASSIKWKQWYYLFHRVLVRNKWIYIKCLPQCWAYSVNAGCYYCYVFVCPNNLSRSSHLKRPAVMWAQSLCSGGIHTFIPILVENSN